jgi:hypothetical protein
MSKQRARHTSSSGQYVSPLLNELEWLDEEPEMRSVTALKKKPLPPRRSSRIKQTSGKQKARIHVENTHANVVTPAPKRQSNFIAPPLLLLNKNKPRAPKSKWARELFGYDSWAAHQADQITDAIQSFQLGLDGLLQSGEKITVIPFHEQERIIDITPEISSVTEEVVEISKEQQLYGFIPFRFGPLEEHIDVTITFKQPFSDQRYALVATTDSIGCYAVISAKSPETAVIRIIRHTDVPYMEGELNWIAIGDADMSGGISEDF